MFTKFTLCQNNLKYGVPLNQNLQYSANNQMQVVTNCCDQYATKSPFFYNSSGKSIHFEIVIKNGKKKIYMKYW